MRSFHGDEALKAEMIFRMEGHANAGELVRGIGWESNGKSGRGSFTGCSFHQFEYELFPVRIGFPEWLGRLADMVCDGLWEPDLRRFAMEFYRVVPVGVDLEPILHKFLAWVCTQNIERLGRLDLNDESKAKVLEVIRQVRGYHENPDRTETERAALESGMKSARNSWGSWISLASAESSAESVGLSRKSVANSARWMVWCWGSESWSKIAEELLRCLAVAS